MYPTARMIGVALLGVPLALLAGLFAPQFWLVGAAWVLVAIALFLLDVMISAAPSRLSFAAKVPGAIGVARPETASVRLMFAGFAPSSVEFAVDTGKLIEPVPERQETSVTAGAAQVDFAIRPLRRGESFVETLWTRWQGPLGLVWKQRKHDLHEKVAIIPNIASIKDEARRLFERESGQMGMRAQLRTGEGTEFNLDILLEFGLQRLLDGLEKKPFLEAFQPDIFFDDQMAHIEPAKATVHSGHVPNGIANEVTVEVRVPKVEEPVYVAPEPVEKEAEPGETKAPVGWPISRKLPPARGLIY